MLTYSGKDDGWYTWKRKLYRVLGTNGLLKGLTEDKSAEGTKLEMVAADVEKAMAVEELDREEDLSSLPIMMVDLLELKQIDRRGVQMESEGVQAKSSSCNQALTSLSSWSKQQSGRSREDRGRRCRKTNNTVRRQGRLKPRMQYDRSVRCLLLVISKNPSKR